MRSVPLKNLFKEGDNSRYFSNAAGFKPQSGFRIIKKPNMSQKMN